MSRARRFIHVSAMALLSLFAALPTPAADKNAAAPGRPLTLIVMDPLARELACACVQGFGQRDYRKLSTRLGAELKERVNIEFSDDLADTLQLIGGKEGEFLLIGDRSLVANDATKASLTCKPLCDLTDRDGNTDLAASFVVRSDDPAKAIEDLAGRKLLV